MRDEVTVLVKALVHVPVDRLRLTGDEDRERLFVEWGTPPTLRVGFLSRTQVAELVFSAWAPHREEGTGDAD